MCRLLAIPVIFLASAVAGTSPTIQQQKSASKPSHAQKHVAKKPSPPIGVSTPNPTSESDASKQKQDSPPKDGPYGVNVLSEPPVDWWVKAYTIATICAVVGGFIGLCLIWKEVKATKIAANAAKASADALKNAERAWILIRLKSDPGWWWFRFKVYGNTPARVLDRDIRFLIAKSLDEIDPIPQYDFSESPKPSVLIKGEERLLRRDFDALGNPTVRQHSAEIRSGDLILYVYGIVKYRDIVDDSKIHETRFGFWYESKRNEFILGGPPDYNRHT